MKHGEIELCGGFNDENICDFNEENDKELRKSREVDYYILQCDLELENIGRGEIIEARITCYNENKFIKANYDFNKSIILKEEVFKVNFEICLVGYEIMKGAGYWNELLIEIKYFDIMNKEYLDTIPIEISVEEPYQYLDESKNEVISDYKLPKHSLGTIKRKEL